MATRINHINFSSTDGSITINSNGGSIIIDNNGINFDGAVNEEINEKTKVTIEINGKIYAVLGENEPIESIRINIEGGCIHSNNLNITATDPKYVENHNGPINVKGSVYGSASTNNGPITVSGDVRGNATANNGPIKVGGKVHGTTHTQSNMFGGFFNF